MAKSISQERAAHALDWVNKKFKGENKDEAKYRAYTASFPFMILNNGLGQACAFYLSNSKEEHKEVYKALEDWLCSHGRPYHDQDQKDLMTAITSQNRDKYILAQAEALEYLQWLKMFADAFLDKKKVDSGPSSNDAENEVQP
jgi:CRISPR-associated protein Cmr5